MTSAAAKWNPWNWFRNEEEALLPSRQGSHGSRGFADVPALPAWGPVSSFYRDIDRIFEQTFRNFGHNFGLPFFGVQNLPGLAGISPGSSFFRPVVDIAANDDEYVVTAEIPGLDESDVKLEVGHEGTLVISGEKRKESEKNEQDYFSSECAYGTFNRVLSLPLDADKERIQADFHNGLLTITVPRLEASKQRPRQIEIAAGTSTTGKTSRGQREDHRRGGAGEQRAAAANVDEASARASKRAA